MRRTELREHIFKMLFCTEFNTEDEMKEQEKLYFELLDMATEAEEDYVIDKYKAILERKEEVDTLLNEYADKWKTTRMNKVDLSILRLAAYEILWDEDVPTAVAINEAVELAKKYSSDEGPAFINGILARVVEKYV